MPFRYRGIRAVIDTTLPAELQLAGYQVSQSTLDQIDRSLTDVTFSDDDQRYDHYHIRVVKDYDIAFVMSREGALVVITIVAVLPHDPEQPMKKIMQHLGKVATLRSASGL